MQYAIIKIDDAEVLIDANELHSLDRYRDAIQDQAFLDETAEPYCICYGCYMPRRSLQDKDICPEFEAMYDHWMGHVIEDKCHFIAFHEAMTFDIVPIGLSRRLPFAALIQATPEIIERIGKRGQAVTAFPRYQDDMSVAQNILNRPGLLALNGLERRKTPITPANWKEAVKPMRAVMQAERIK